MIPETTFRFRDRSSDRSGTETAYETRKRIHVEVLSEETRGIWNREEPSTTSGLAESAEPLLGDTNRFHRFRQKLDCRDETASDAVRIENVGDVVQEPDSVRGLLRPCVKYGKSALGRDEGFEQSEIRENRGHGPRKVVGVLEEVPDTLLK